MRDKSSGGWQASPSSAKLPRGLCAEVRNLNRRFLELFESLGNVGSGVRAILRPHELVDGPAATERRIARGAIEFDSVDFEYADGAQVFRGLSVSIPGGQRVGLVGLFHRTLRDNIRYGDSDATDSEVEGAARRANSDEFIASIPGQYDAEVGERGVKLSGGQRQRTPSRA
jgi:ATP-binding cassette, subfamily B, bacterial